jgi:hypothetical protein
MPRRVGARPSHAAPWERFRASPAGHAAGKRLHTTRRRRRRRRWPVSRPVRARRLARPWRPPREGYRAQDFEGYGICEIAARHGANMQGGFLKFTSSSHKSQFVLHRTCHDSALQVSPRSPVAPPAIQLAPLRETRYNYLHVHHHHHHQLAPPRAATLVAPCRQAAFLSCHLQTSCIPVLPQAARIALAATRNEQAPHSRLPWHVALRCMFAGLRSALVCRPLSSFEVRRPPAGKTWTISHTP